MGLNATSIRDLLLREGLFTINAKPMGGKMVLLEGQSPSEIEELLKTEKEWFESIFLEMRKWSPSKVVRERYVWIRCFGIPVQAWEEDFFSMLASKWGRMVELERKTKNRERLDIGSFLIATTSNRCIDESIPVKVGDLIVDIRVVEDPLEMMGWDAGPEDSEELSSQESEEGVSETFFDEVWPETPQGKGLADGQDGEEEDVSSQGRSIPRNLRDKSVGLVQQILALSTPSRSNSRKGKAKNKEDKAEDAVLGGIRNGEITKNRKEVSGGGGSRLEATAVTATEEGIDRVKVTVRSNQNLQIREEDHSFLNSKYVGPVTSLGQAQKEKGHNGQKTVQLKKKKVGFISPKSSKLPKRGKKVQERNRFSSLSEEDSSEKSEDCYLRSLVIKNRARFADSKTEKGMTSGTKGRGESAIEGTGILEKKSLTSKVGKRKMEVAKMFCCKLPRILQNHKKKRKSPQNSFDRRTQKKSVKSKAEGLSRSTRSTRSDLQSVEPDPSIDNSISDSNVHCVNRLLLRYGDKVAVKLWEVGKSIGVTFDGEDCEMIRKIGELERKDRLGSEDHNHREQEGRSGGILCLWDGKKFRKRSVTKGAGFVAILGEWYQGDVQVMVITIYSSCIYREKISLWEEVWNLRHSSNTELWCVMGDFNTIRESSERRGRSFLEDCRGMEMFNTWIDRMDLIDLPLIGRKYSCYHAGGVAMSENQNQRDWFDDNLWIDLGRGDKARFWQDRWVGDRKLKDLFPRLFLLSQNKHSLVKDCGCWNQNVWSWNLGWRRQLFAWEEELVLHLNQIIQAKACSISIDDGWKWGSSSRGLFEVKEA
ncbi:hypothetical protein RIF29_24810 [Crotalaria pallida]|uniref:DUF4283 domain-containing protein n=1 Tax=Crotalaria pallida TaxID=3830 RepID=A0AAN9I0I6_CROPI